MKKIIENVKFIQDGTLVFGDLHLEDGFVERIDYKTPHMESSLVIPGFVDIHTHGCMGIDADSTDAEQLQRLATLYPKVGVTAFCATISSRSLEEYIPVIEAYKKAFQGAYKGARFMGLHLEGPYLNPSKAGSIDVTKIHAIHIPELDTFLSNHHDMIRIMTIAPELENAMEAIRLLHLYGIEVSLGHTQASYEIAQEAFENGASQITHLGNTMPRLDHHKETMMDAVFLNPVLCEIIMDGIHMQKHMLQWVITLLGAQRVIAVSDSKYAGLASDHPVDINEHIRLDGAVYEDGKLVKGCQDLLTTFTLLRKELHYNLIDCIAMCSTNAAKMLKTYTHEISLGKQIDFVILDHNLNLQDVVIGGKSV